jgi:DNA sulfur modification protein DndD
MLLERLEFQNFSSYYGEHSIDLSITSERPVVIVVGGNGYGKTSIFDAINWSLYGEDYERDIKEHRGRNILDYVNESALSEAKSQNGTVEMACTLYFEHKGIHYYISRALVAEPMKTDSKQIKCRETDRTTALYQILSSGNHKRMEYDSIFLDEILPSNVRDYFLFDGDRIYKLSNPGSSKDVRDAIYRVVDLELIENARNHLTDVAKEYRREAKAKSTGELANVEEQYSQAREKLQKFKKEEDDHKREEQAIREQIDTLEAKLRNLPDTSQLQARRSEKADQLNRTENQIDVNLGEMRGYAAKAIPITISDLLLNLMNDLDAKRQRGQIPKKVSQTLLEDLLALKRCLCGTEFQEGDKIQHALKERLEYEKSRSSGQELLDLLIALKTASEVVSIAVDELDKSDALLHSLNETRRELDIALHQIDTDLEKLPKEDINAITTAVRERRTDLVTVTRKLQQVADAISSCEVAIRDLDKQRSELAKKQADARKLQLREMLAQKAVDNLSGIYEDFAEDSRRNVEELTRQEFYKFVESSSHYSVALSTDYELVVLDSNGNPALQRLSMGQAQCLSLAFITSISRVSEKNPPLVIDMPFGRLDDTVHKVLSRRLPEISSQLLLFLLPRSEWNEVTQNNLIPKANHIYNLEFDKSRRNSSIVKLKEPI